MKTKRVGIITVPLSPDKKYYEICGNGYISTSHISLLSDAGLEVVPIPYDTDNYKYYMDRINGLYIPSGGLFANYNLKFYNTCKNFINLAILANDRNEYFPVWGTCLGMEILMIIADGNDNLQLLDKFDTLNDLNLPLYEYDYDSDYGYGHSRTSKLMKNASKSFRKDLEDRYLSLHNHMLGVSLKKFYDMGLDQSLNIVHVSFDRKHKPFVSTIEFKDYPFYGVQWHPERDDNMLYFIMFFKSEVFKNNKKLKTRPKQLDQVTIDCMNYSRHIYNHCTFFWNKPPINNEIEKCKDLEVFTYVKGGV